MKNAIFLTTFIIFCSFFCFGSRRTAVLDNGKTYLNLNRKALTEIPEYVFDQKELKVLKLFGNHIKEISSRIGELENLEELYIGRNDLTTLPIEIRELKKLKILSVQSNRLNELPVEIGELQNLEQLWLNQNNLTTIPSSIGKLKKIFKIRLEFNFLTELPAEIGECESLSLLYLERNNLTKLPEELGKLNQLKEIYLASAGVLIDVPETFCYLRFLEIIEIDGTTAIPPCLLVLRANRLKIIQK
jgi:Leucine-rich repeat (LRR) protein